MKPEITYDDFQKLDIRVAKVLTAEPVPKTDRLLHLTLDIGEEEPRNVVAGIREFYEPERLIGKYVTYLANLAPRKLRGIESRGMILAAVNVDDNNKVTALSVLEATAAYQAVIKPGAEVG